MKNFGFLSSYAKYGALCGAVLFCMYSLPSIVRHSIQRAQSYTWEERMQRSLDEPTRIWRDEFRDENWRSESKTPCYEVTIDNDLLIGLEDFKSGNFGEEVLDIDHLLTEEFKTSLAAEFSTRTWQNENHCFDGSFVISFRTEADGSLGTDMLTHNIKGGAHGGGTMASRVVLDLDARGHRWHDGTLPAGEVRLPVRFRMQ